MNGDSSINIEGIVTSKLLGSLTIDHQQIETNLLTATVTPNVRPLSRKHSDGNIFLLSTDTDLPHHRHHHNHQHEGPFIGEISDARIRHPWLVYNHNIHKGYRINYHTYKVLFKSLGQCHNETTNIWSHLLGVFCFAFLLIYFAVYYKPFDLNIKLEEKAVRFGEREGLVFTPIFDKTVSQIYSNTSLASSTSALFQPTSRDAVRGIIEEMGNLESGLKSSLSGYDEKKIYLYS